MANGNGGISGRNFDAFVSSQRTFSDYDFAAKIEEKYWRARQKFLSKIEKKEDTCIVLSDSKLDAKLEIYRSIDKSCGKLINILENYQNCLYMFANEENAFGVMLKEFSKHDKTKAGKIMAMAGKSLTQTSHQTMKLYMPLLRLYQEMETFHTRAVCDTNETVERLENRRSQYRASLLWMKDVSENLDPDIYRQLDKFRRIQNQVRSDKKTFDGVKMDVVQKIDLLMASRCNLLNQIVASYQLTLLETFEKNSANLKSIEELIRSEDIYEYEFETLKQLNPLNLSDPDLTVAAESSGPASEGSLNIESAQTSAGRSEEEEVNLFWDSSEPDQATASKQDVVVEPENARSLFGEDTLIDLQLDSNNNSENILDMDNIVGSSTAANGCVSNDIVDLGTHTNGNQTSGPKPQGELIDLSSDDAMNQLEELFNKVMADKS